MTVEEKIGLLIDKTVKLQYEYCSKCQEGDCDYCRVELGKDGMDGMDNDLIDRQKAIDTALTFFVEFLGGAFHEDDQRKLITLYEELPSIQPRKGKWIEASEDWRNQITWWQCSECGTPSSIKSNFCPNCGCRMEEGDSDEGND